MSSDGGTGGRPAKSGTKIVVLSPDFYAALATKPAPVFHVASPDITGQW